MVSDQPNNLSNAQLATEYTGPQSIMGIGWLWASGGSPANPCAFPRYLDGYGRTYWTYRWMLQHPIVRLVRSVANSPIIASYWQYKGRDDKVPQERIDFIGEVFDRLRQKSITDILRGRDYGWAGFEPIWEIEDGRTVLTELKPLSVDWTTILVNKKGRFVGLSQHIDGELKVDTGQSEQTGLPSPFKAWLYTYDRECGNLYGRSWLENIRETAWKDWLDCAQQLQKLGAKLSGVQSVSKSPAHLKEQTIDAVKALALGAPGVWLPNLVDKVDPGANVELIKLLGMLAKSSFIDLTPVDFGSTAPAIAGILERMQHDEELMFAGGLRPSRSGLEGQHGTKAEAGVHTDTGMLASELDDDDIASQMQPLVDAVGSLNFAGYKPGDVFIDPPPLVDSKAQRFGDFLQALSTNKDVSTALAQYADIDQVLEGLDIPIREGATFEVKVAPPPALMNGAPGNGKANGQKSPMVQRLGNRMKRAGLM